MYDRPKGNFSFLIAFAKQLAAALDTHRDDDVGSAVDSLGASLVVLIADSCEDAGDDDGGIPEGVDDLDAPGDDSPLGAALARIAELESSGAPDVVISQQRRAVGGGVGTLQRPLHKPVGARRQRRHAPLLKKGKRRGKA